MAERESGVREVQGFKGSQAGKTAQAILATGLHDRWYGICPSERIAGRPVALTRWGRDLVAWRDRDGAVRLLDDRCPHRGARLSLARHDGDRLSCVYHGAQILGDGVVAAVPGEPGCALVGQRAVRSYPACEHRGAVFAWYGSDPDMPPPAFAPPQPLAGTDHEAILCYAEWRCPYRFLIDNNMDPMHGAYLHRTAHSMQQGSRRAEFRTRDTATGFVFEKTGQKDLNFDWSEWYDRDFQAVCLEIPYPATGGPGGNFGIVFHVTPIDERSSACFFWRHRKVRGWQADVWKFLYRTRLEERHWHVLEQDRLVMETLAADADAHERLYSHDLGLKRVRGLLAREARAQAKALARSAAGQTTMPASAAPKAEPPAGQGGGTEETIMPTSVRFEQITAPEVPEMPGNIFSNCLRVGDRLVLAGMVASDAAGGTIGGDSAYEQARACFAKIGKLVEAAGGSLADVAKLTIYLTDMADRPALARARSEFFAGRMPASTLIGVSALAEPQYRVEIEAIAFLGAAEESEAG